MSDGLLQDHGDRIGSLEERDRKHGEQIVGIQVSVRSIERAVKRQLRMVSVQDINVRKLATMISATDALSKATAKGLEALEYCVTEKQSKIYRLLKVAFAVMALVYGGTQSSEWTIPLLKSVLDAMAKWIM